MEKTGTDSRRSLVKGDGSVTNDGVGGSEGCIDVLRKGLKALPTNKTLRARLAGACAVNQRPQEAPKHYRWLFENAGGVQEKLSWVLQMKLVGDSAEEVRRWFLWQRVAHLEDATPLIYASEDASAYPDPKLEERLRRSSGGKPELKQLRRGRQALQMRHFPEAVEVLRALANEDPSTGNRLQLVRALIYGELHVQALTC